MNNTTKKILSVLLAVVLLVSAFPVMSASAATVANVGSLWDGFTAGSGTFTVTSVSRVFVVGSSAPTGELLQTAQLIQRELKAQFSSYDLEMVWGDESWATTGDIVLKLDSSSGTGTDGYKLDVNDTTATVTAADVDGLIYGANNLIKCFRAVGSNAISGFSGNDAPDTKERTVHLDVARKYYTADWICNFIRQMSWMGYNALELHTSEDGGFRADLWDPVYYTGNYNPENDFSWLCGSHIQSWVEDPYRTDPHADKYLTTAELVQICDVAKEYHIEIIPSFDSPAHMDYISWKFEQNYLSDKDYSFTYNGTTYKASSTSGCINYTKTTGESSPTWPNYAAIDITDGTMAKAFVFALYEDMADFFKEYAGSTKFMIGADEVNLERYADTLPRTWSYDQFPGYINDLNKMLNGKGYTVRMFNDFIGSTTYNQKDSKAVYTFDKNIEIVYWNSDFNPTTNRYGTPDNQTWHVAFFWHNGTTTENVGSEWPPDGWGDGGRTVYNAIQTNCYYSLRVAGATTAYRGMDGRNPLNLNWSMYHSTEEDIFNEWYPADISEKGLYRENASDVPEQFLGGAYFLIWSDYAATSTEQEIWEGAPDVQNGSTKYYLLDRMWSNSIKMWNSDINNSTVTYSDNTKDTYNGTVTYSEFAAVRDTFGYFPGYTFCSEPASLPAATSHPAKAEEYVADHSALTAALAAVKTEQGNYTDESWAAYQAAIAEARNVNASASATTEEIAAAVKSLREAEAALEIKSEDDTEIINIRKLSQYATKGKKIGMVITTTTDVETLNVYLDGTLIELTLNLHNTQTLNGEDVGVWMVNFPATVTGNFTYTITVNGTVSETVAITVK